MTRSPTRSSSKREAALSQREVLDTVVAAETPEGIVLELSPAGVSVRFYAFALDWAIRLAIFYGATMMAQLMAGVGVAFALILLFLLEWFYPVLFELSMSGATPGKRTFRLKVVMDNGLPITPAASVTRNLLRAADFLPFGYGFAIVSMLTRRDCKRLGDVAAATLVVHEAKAVPRIEMDSVPPLAPMRPLAQQDEAAIVALAARANRLTPARLDELAALAAPITGDTGRSGPDVTRRVLGVAQWVMGQR